MGSGRESSDAPEGLKRRSGGYVGEEESLGGTGGNAKMIGEVTEGDGGIGRGEESIDGWMLRHCKGVGVETTG